MSEVVILSNYGSLILLTTPEMFRCGNEIHNFEISTNPVGAIDVSDLVN
tara:strand:+ start:2690 stop:2836 length:147 start_codon:yes stop_codon:yes gene_type:complete